MRNFQILIVSAVKISNNVPELYTAPIKNSLNRQCYLLASTLREMTTQMVVASFDRRHPQKIPRVQ